MVKGTRNRSTFVPVSQGSFFFNLSFNGPVATPKRIDKVYFQQMTKKKEKVQFGEGEKSTVQCFD